MFPIHVKLGWISQMLITFFQSLCDLSLKQKLKLYLILIWIGNLIWIENWNWNWIWFRLLTGESWRAAAGEVPVVGHGHALGAVFTVVGCARVEFRLALGARIGHRALTLKPVHAVHALARVLTRIAGAFVNVHLTILAWKTGILRNDFSLVCKKMLPLKTREKCEMKEMRNKRKRNDGFQKKLFGKHHLLFRQRWSHVRMSRAVRAPRGKTPPFSGRVKPAEYDS